MGAYDNILLGALYQALFGEPFAAAKDGVPLSGSVTAEALREAFASIRSREAFESLESVLRRSRRAACRLAAHEGVEIEIPRVLPTGRVLPARLRATARRLLGGAAMAAS